MQGGFNEDGTIFVGDGNGFIYLWTFDPEIE
jgi:hypothetical protein